MITKINAELDSIETAELAARMIKHKTSGIINIKIEKNSDNISGVSGDNDELPFIIPSYTHGNSYFFYPPKSDYNLINSTNDNNKNELVKTVVIEVICEKEAEKTVAQVFSSLGGLKINKN